MNALQVFSFNGMDSVRCIDRNGEPWFVAKDVADALGYQNSRKAIIDHCKASVSVSDIGGIVSLPLDKQTKIIPERDVYRLIFRSKLPSAEAFEDWVVSEVLPSIRKTGGYQADTEKLLQMVSDLSAKIDSISSQPKADFIKVKDIANMIGVGYTSQDVNQALMAIGLQVKYHIGRQAMWMPTNKAKAYCKKIGSGLIWDTGYIAGVKEKIQQILEIKV